MNKKLPRGYLILFAAILACMSLPSGSTESLRGFAVSTLAPAWSYLAEYRDLGSGPQTAEHQQRLLLENHLLIAELERLHEVLLQESALQRAVPQTKSLAPLLARHRQQMKESLKFRLQMIPARVIFRSPTSWNSSLWINVGRADNARFQNAVVAKNSPVMVGASVVGVIDYVGERQSRVRLITDSGLTPSVRAVRGDPFRRQLSETIAQLRERLTQWQEPHQEEWINPLLGQLQIAESKLQQGEVASYLAKGELHGHSQPLWRSLGSTLQGVGFNYDFPDQEGTARDLRTGVPLSGEGKVMNLLQVNDLLVTTGMDGVFPPGLQVAYVTKIQMLHEGDYAYELEARPTAGNLNALSVVYVMPHVGYESDDQPPLGGSP